MRFLSVAIAPLLLTTILICASCGMKVESNQNSAASGDSQNVTQNNRVKDDLVELNRVINLPFEPVEVVWQEDNPAHKNAKNQSIASSEKSEKRIVAVLQFTSEDSARLVAQAEKYAPAKSAVIDAESWFPVELIAQSQLSGDETLKGNSYAADDFFLAPFTNGTLTRIDNTNFFVLEIASA